MKKNILFAILFFGLCSSAFAQDYNPLVQNVRFSPEPNVLGFECCDTPSVKFQLGLSSADDLLLDVNDPLIVKMAKEGVRWRDLSNAAANVHGLYTQNFNWTFSSNMDTIIGTQIATMNGTGVDPLNLVNSLEEMTVDMYVPVQAFQALRLYVFFETPNSTATSNDFMDDSIQIETQSWCIGGCALPITLATFEVNEFQCQARLVWQTASEQNSSHVEIYRRLASKKEFNKIGAMALQGNSDEVQDYEFIDDGVESGRERYEYKLKFIDLDQKYSESEVRSIHIDCGKGHAGIKLYPDPVLDRLHLDVESRVSASQLKIKIIDINGRILLRDAEILDEGANSLQYDMSDLSSGLYILQYENEEDNKVGSLKFLKK